MFGLLFNLRFIEPSLIQEHNQASSLVTQLHIKVIRCGICLQISWLLLEIWSPPIFTFNSTYDVFSDDDYPNISPYLSSTLSSPPSTPFTTTSDSSPDTIISSSTYLTLLSLLLLILQILQLIQILVGDSGSKVGNRIENTRICEVK